MLSGPPVFGGQPYTNFLVCPINPTIGGPGSPQQCKRLSGQANGNQHLRYLHTLDYSLSSAFSLSQAVSLFSIFV